MNMREQERTDIISWHTETCPRLSKKVVCFQRTEDVSMTFEKESCFWRTDDVCVHGFGKRKLFSFRGLKIRPWLWKEQIVVFRELNENSDFGFRSKLKVVKGCISYI